MKQEKKNYLIYESTGLIEGEFLEKDLFKPSKKLYYKNRTNFVQIIKNGKLLNCIIAQNEDATLKIKEILK